MRNVVVVGPPGSGKTTVGARVARQLGLRHVEVDALWWEPNWTEADLDVFRARLASTIAAEGWVLDGNYFSNGMREVVWPRADTIVWLDLARWVTIPRVVWRTGWRAARRMELWSGNRESLRLALRPDSIIVYAWKAHPKYNRRYETLEVDPNLAHVTWVRRRSRCGAGFRR
jgi:adenylate kinase family enzyme